MRISALAERTGVPVVTLKFYLREGLLQPGTATARTQAQYGEAHVERVRLVRALTESASLSHAAVRQVLAALDDPPPTWHELLGTAQRAMLASEEAGRRPPGRASGTEGDEAEGVDGDPWRRRATALAEARGWCSEDDPLVERLAAQLRAAEAAGVRCDDQLLQGYAEAADTLAAADLASVPRDLADALRQVVVGTLMTDPVILTMRRLAQQRASAEAERQARGRRRPPSGA